MTGKKKKQSKMNVRKGVEDTDRESGSSSPSKQASDSVKEKLQKMIIEEEK